MLCLFVRDDVYAKQALGAHGIVERARVSNCLENAVNASSSVAVHCTPLVYSLAGVYVQVCKTVGHIMFVLGSSGNRVGLTMLSPPLQVFAHVSPQLCKSAKFTNAKLQALHASARPTVKAVPKTSPIDTKRTKRNKRNK